MVKISGLPVAVTSDVSDDDLISVVDNATNTTKRVTRQQFVGGGTDYTGLAVVPTVVSTNGQKENVLSYNSIDYTGSIQKGTKLRIPRAVAPPTQAMSFTLASSQYATKASPTGITFTSAFTAEAWVYINSYPSTLQTIIARQDSANTTGGWAFHINSNGQITVQYGSSTTFTQFASYQSVPLKQWVHIAGVVTSTASKTGQTYLNGVPIQTQTVLSNSTSLTQASVDLRVGAFSANPASTYLDGYMSEARVWSTAQTQTQIQNNMGISLTGSETGLVALFQGNGNFNDKTTNANNLTATNGAIATQLSNPYSPVEYGIIVNVTYTGSNTLATVFTGPYVIPNATLGSTSYSSARAPYGFNPNRNAWRISVPIRYNLVANFVAVTQWLDTGVKITIPTGEWSVGYQGTFQQNGTGAGVESGYFTLQSFVPTTNVWLYDLLTRLYNGQGTTVLLSSYLVSPRSLTSQTTSTLYVGFDSGQGAVNWQVRGDQGIVELFAECAYI